MLCCFDGLLRSDLVITILCNMLRIWFGSVLIRPRFLCFAHCAGSGFGPITALSLVENGMGQQRAMSVLGDSVQLMSPLDLLHGDSKSIDVGLPTYQNIIWR